MLTLSDCWWLNKIFVLPELKVSIMKSFLVFAQKLTRSDFHTLGEWTNSIVKPDFDTSLARTTNYPKGLLCEESKFASQIPESAHKYRWQSLGRLRVVLRICVRMLRWLSSDSKVQLWMSRNLSKGKATCGESIELIVARAGRLGGCDQSDNY